MNAPNQHIDDHPGDDRWCLAPAKSRACPQKSPPPCSNARKSEDACYRGRDWSQRLWFRTVAKRMEGHITQVYRSSATDDFCFTVSVPIIDGQGHLLRVLDADVRLSALV